MKYTALDLCSGAGGVTTGMRRLGINVVGAVDNDPDCVKTMRANHRKTRVVNTDLLTCDPAELRLSLGLKRGKLDILTACTPCQTFSSIATKNARARDSRAALVSRVREFVKEFRPRALIMENVPQLRRHYRFKRLVRELQSLGYCVQHHVVCASDAGVPQKRTRLVCVAVRGVRSLPVLDLRQVSARFRKLSTVRDAFNALAKVPDRGDVLRRGRQASGVVLERIKCVPKDGGSRDSFDTKLELRCHRRLRKRGEAGSSNVYGRMSWDDLAPTLTTRCTTPACGRFIHPSKNRPITLREAAVLQSFPLTYKFVGTMSSIERQIGNAVPPSLAAATARYVLNVLPRRASKG
jgi:DNA (cytosine-5)-methyltransferase 1